MKRSLSLLAALLVAATHPASAQTIEQAEADLKAAKEAAQRAREQQAVREAETRSSEAARLAQALRRGTLILQSDADCALSIDGTAQGQLSANQPRSLEVAPGEQLIRCAATEEPETVVELIKAVDGGSKQVVKLELAALVKPKVDTSTPGAVFRDQLKDGSEGPEMVVIPGGSFMMGSPESEADRAAGEGPQHQVTLPAFAMGRTEVTVAQFRRFVNATGYRTDAEQNTDVPGNESTELGCYSYDGSNFGYTASSSWRQPGLAQGDSHPAVCLSWNDAQAYVEWLADETGKAYRLPSEAQQEYVIRAGSASRFAWGSDLDLACGYANAVDQTTRSMFAGMPAVNCTDGFVFTSPTGNVRANAFGLFDTVGNALEWSADCWNGSYAGAPTDGSAWSSGDCSRRVLRGAGWSSTPVDLRAASRFSAPRTYRVDLAGLRLIQEL